MGTHQLIYIRTDGNSNIASGHLVRCFSIALACRKLEMEVRFLVSSAESRILLEGIAGTNTGFSITQLETASYDTLEQELPEVLSILSSHACSSSSFGCTPCAAPKPVFLLDSYYVTERYLSSLRPYVKTAYLDDLRLFDYPVDLLINYDMICDDKMVSYQSAYQNAGQLLLGASYTPLREQFQNHHATVREKVSNILITSGGSDPLHFCLRLISHIASIFHAAGSSCSPVSTSLADMRFHIVIGKLNEDKEKLCQLAKDYSFLTLHENVQDMAALMVSCDLAVSAAGTTLYELCALGIPTVSFIMADNQSDCACAFDAAKVIPCAGDLRISGNEVFQKILQFLLDNSDSSKDSFLQRKTIHDQMIRLVGKDGADRIAQSLQTLGAHEEQAL